MTELEQFIAKLEELERTMTRGQWKVDEYDGFMLVYADFDPESPRRDYGVIHCATCAPAPLDNGNAHGIVHLKNSNPTVIAMLKAAIEGLKAAFNTAHDEEEYERGQRLVDRAHEESKTCAGCKEMVGHPVSHGLCSDHWSMMHGGFRIRDKAISANLLPPRASNALHDCIAHLNTLAQEALGTTGGK